MFAQNLGNLKGIYCFPPICLIAPILSLLKSQKAKAVVIVPEVRDAWWSVLKEGEIDSMYITLPDESEAFLSTKKNGYRMFEKFKFRFLAVLLNFT